ncbi:MAG: N-acetyl sugar amidotransferase [Sulfuricaulis sp.]|nr:N-acetyl sugar amidotransferase [Sulfuricaulis sp.]
MIKFCTRCVISSMRPRIAFDADGVCSACRFAEAKAATDWTAREAELKRLCDWHRSNNGSFDVVVPVSGGKDGGFVAHQLRTVYGMTPLCVTWAPLLPTDIGRQNLDAFVAHGFDVIQGRPNGETTRALTKLAFEHMGDPFLPFIYGQTNFPLQMAVRYQIPLIMYGEDGEAEYGGAVKEPRAQRKIEDHDEQYFSGKPPSFWTEHGLDLRQLKPFQAPPYREIKANGTQIHFFGYYKPWDPQENFYHCAEHTGFSPNPERTEGTYSKYASLDDRLDGLHYYLAYIKFGIGRCTSDSAHEIRDGKITREEGVALVHKFDGEFPVKHYQDALDYMGLSHTEAARIIDSWRSPEVWDGFRLRARVE